MERTTDHYVFHYREHSTAESEIVSISTLQEECYRFISRCLGTEANGKIHYHFYDTPEEVGSQYAAIHDNGDDEPCNGFALPETMSRDGLNHIYAVYNDKVKCVGFHEDAHIISYSLGRPDSGFVREGLAMFFDRYWWGIDNYSWTRWYLEQGKMPSVKALFRNEAFDANDDTTVYPVAGAFTSYLIECYGMDRYIAFYKACKDDAEHACEEVFSVPPAVMETRFTDHIKLFQLRKEIRDLMEQDTRD